MGSLTQNDYFELDVSVDDRFFQEVEQRELELVEEGLRPTEYSISVVAVADNPESLRSEILERAAYVEVEGQNPELVSEDLPDETEQFTFYQDVGSRDPSDIALDILLSMLESEAETISNRLGWPTDNVAVSMRGQSDYVDLLSEGTENLDLRGTESTSYFLKAQSGDKTIKNVINSLEKDAYLGVKIQEDGCTEYKLYDQSVPDNFREIPNLGIEYNPEL